MLYNKEAAGVRSLGTQTREQPCFLQLEKHTYNNKEFSAAKNKYKENQGKKKLALPDSG